MPRTKQFDVEDTLTKAMTAFWQRGYQSTSMQNLVDCMGINRGSIYATYGGKHSLFVKALRHYITIWRQDRLSGIARSTSPTQAILDVFERDIAAAMEDGSCDGCLVTNTALELAPHDPEVAEIVASTFAEAEGFFRTSIAQGKADGEISTGVDAERTARSLLSLHLGLRVLVRSRREEPLLRSIADQAATLLRG